LAVVKRSFAAVFTASALFAVVPSGSLATTSPAYNFPVHVLITNNDVILDRSAAKRGWLAHFYIKNKSTKTIRFEIGGLTSKPVKPGQTGKLGAYMELRGQYTYHVENSKKTPLKDKGGFFEVT
jgi:hypothetical protein